MSAGPSRPHLHLQSTYDYLLVFLFYTLFFTESLFSKGRGKFIENYGRALLALDARVLVLAAVLVRTVSRPRAVLGLRDDTLRGKMAALEGVTQPAHVQQA